MMLLYLVFFALACAVFAMLWFFAPSLAGWTKLLIAIGVFVALVIAATVWINWAAQQMPDDAQILVPPKKVD